VAADGGTLFLDEIGELPLDVQPALLRALETGEISAVGEDAPRRVRVRVIAATHRDLAALVADGRFRQDLYYRFAVVTLDVPPLRDRREDIVALAELFAREEGAANLDDDILEELSQRSYPGNVRELRNAVLAFMALGTLGAASVSAAMPQQQGQSAVSATKPRLDVPYLAQRDALVEDFTRNYVAAVLDRTGGNQTEAARIAGLDRTYFGRLLARLGRPKK